MKILDILLENSTERERIIKRAKKIFQVYGKHSASVAFSNDGKIFRWNFDYKLIEPEFNVVIGYEGGTAVININKMIIEGKPIPYFNSESVFHTIRNTFKKFNINLFIKNLEYTEPNANPFSRDYDIEEPINEEVSDPIKDAQLHRAKKIFKQYAKGETTVFLPVSFPTHYGEKKEYKIRYHINYKDLVFSYLGPNVYVGVKKMIFPNNIFKLEMFNEEQNKWVLLDYEILRETYVRIVEEIEKQLINILDRFNIRLHFPIDNVFRMG